MRRIDLHAHVITPGYDAALPPAPRPPQSVDGLRAFMEQYEIDAAVVSMGGSLAASGPEMARTGNLELAELVRGEPGTFGALAVVPFTAGDPDLATAEAVYALDELGLDGVALFSNHAGSYLGEPEWEGLFTELDRRGAYAFVHPAAAPNGMVLDRYPPWMFEYPFDTTRALVNMIYTGTFDRHPNVRFQFAHLGGTALFIAQRITSLADREPDKAAGAAERALSYLSRQYYDTGLSNNTIALASTLEVTPLEHVVYGSDWPYLAKPPGRDPSDDFNKLEADIRGKIDVDNAAALVPRLFAAA